LSLFKENVGFQIRTEERPKVANEIPGSKLFDNLCPQKLWIRTTLIINENTAPLDELKKTET
jgi:hypothetical protein